MPQKKAPVQSSVIEALEDDLGAHVDNPAPYVDPEPISLVYDMSQYVQQGGILVRRQLEVEQDSVQAGIGDAVHFEHAFDGLSGTTILSLYGDGYSGWDTIVQPYETQTADRPAIVDGVYLQVHNPTSTESSVTVGLRHLRRSVEVPRWSQRIKTGGQGGGNATKTNAPSYIIELDDDRWGSNETPVPAWTQSTISLRADDELILRCQASGEATLVAKALVRTYDPSQRI